MNRDYRLCRWCLSRVPPERHFCNKCNSRRVRLMRERHGYSRTLQARVEQRQQAQAQRREQDLAESPDPLVRSQLALEQLERLCGKPAPLPASPTNALPGSPWKMVEMMERASRGESLFHPLDATFATPQQVAGILGAMTETA